MTSPLIMKTALVFIRRLPEPERDDGDAGLFARLGTVVGKPWAVLVVLLALIEGGVILGF